MSLKITFGLYCSLLLVHSCVYAIYDPNAGIKTKATGRHPPRSEPIVMHHQYSQVASNRPLDSNREGRTSYTNEAENYVAQYGSECPPNATGQYPYVLNCRQFLNCWKGRGFVQSCAPGTVFNPDTRECDNPEKVICLNYRGESNPNSHFAQLRQVKSSGYSDSATTVTNNGGRSPSPSDLDNVQCDPGSNGVQPHPFDCSKFLNCANGITYIQVCGPGTVFNAIALVCDFPYNVDCSGRNARVSPSAGSDSTGRQDQHHLHRTGHQSWGGSVDSASSAATNYDRTQPGGSQTTGREEQQYHYQHHQHRIGHQGWSGSGGGSSVRRNEEEVDSVSSSATNYDQTVQAPTNAHHYPYHQHNHHHHRPGSYHHHPSGQLQPPPPPIGWRHHPSPQGEQASLNQGTNHHHDTTLDNSEDSEEEATHQQHDHQHDHSKCNHTHHNHNHRHHPHHRHSWNRIHNHTHTFHHSREFHHNHPEIRNPFATNDLDEAESPDRRQGSIDPRIEPDPLDADKPACQFNCQNGKCIREYQVCDGVNDCGNRQDEANCDHIGYEVRLSSDEGKANMGRVEVKVNGEWGYVCDDKFGMRAADILCRELGFVLGAAEVRGNSFYPPHQNMSNENGVRYLMDEVDCMGNETSIRECNFDGWGVHDCSPDEVVGVVCKVPVMTCPLNYWLCKTSQECVAVGFLCDSVPDCQDESDESQEICNATVQYRLRGGSSDMEGRVEVKYRGTWGTICDDDFGPKEAQVICRTLGYLGEATVLKNIYGPGSGPTWLDQVSCLGNETTLEQCNHWAWGEHNCDHTEDVSVRCSERRYNHRAEPTTSTTMQPMVEQYPEEDIDLFLYKVQRSSKSLNQNKRCGQINEHTIDEFNVNDEFARVVNGTKAVRGHHPWQASLRAKGRNGMSTHWCGAILITQLHVLTAAHCLVGYQKEALFIRMGDHYSKIAEPSEIDSFIHNWYVHEDFRKGHHMNNDIGLIVLKSPVIFNDYIQPICLPPKDAVYEVGMQCTISGWGSIKSGVSTPSNNLKAAHVPIISQDVCKEPYVYGKAITDGMFCAGYLDEGVDACDGDSGGPLACSTANGETLYGIISWGQHCGQANKPGVYVKVSYYLDWIMEKIMFSIKSKRE